MLPLRERNTRISSGGTNTPSPKVLQFKASCVSTTRKWIHMLMESWKRSELWRTSTVSPKSNITYWKFGTLYRLENIILHDTRISSPHLKQWPSSMDIWTIESGHQSCDIGQLQGKCLHFARYSSTIPRLLQLDDHLHSYSLPHQHIRFRYRQFLSFFPSVFTKVTTSNEKQT